MGNDQSNIKSDQKLSSTPQQSQRPDKTGIGKIPTFPSGEGGFPSSSNAQSFPSISSTDCYHPSAVAASATETSEGSSRTSLGGMESLPDSSSAVKPHSIPILQSSIASVIQEPSLESNKPSIERQQSTVSQPIAEFLQSRWASMTDSDENLSRCFSSGVMEQAKSNSVPIDGPLKVESLVGASRDLLRRLSENRVAGDVFKQEVENYVTRIGIDKTFITATHVDDENDDVVLRHCATSPRIDIFYNLYEKITSNVPKDMTKPPTESLLDKIPLDDEGNPTSIGSRIHGTGECRPCAFINNPKKERCANGVACNFCHFKHPNRVRTRLRKNQRAFRKLMESKEENAAGLSDKSSLDPLHLKKEEEEYSAAVEEVLRRESSMDHPADFSVLARLLPEFKSGSFEYLFHPDLPSRETLIRDSMPKTNAAGRSLLSLIKGEAGGPNETETPLQGVHSSSSFMNTESVSTWREPAGNTITSLLAEKHLGDHNHLTFPHASHHRDVPMVVSPILYELAGNPSASRMNATVQSSRYFPSPMIQPEPWSISTNFHSPRSPPPPPPPPRFCFVPPPPPLIDPTGRNSRQRR